MHLAGQHKPASSGPVAAHRRRWLCDGRAPRRDERDGRDDDRRHAGLEADVAAREGSGARVPRPAVCARHRADAAKDAWRASTEPRHPRHPEIPAQEVQGPDHRPGFRYGHAAASRPRAAAPGRSRPGTPPGGRGGPGGAAGPRPFEYTSHSARLPGGGAVRAARPGVRRRTQGGIIGVVSKSKDTSIRLYNGRSHYNEWIFQAVQRTQTPGGATGAGTPGGGGGPGQPTPGGRGRGQPPGGGRPGPGGPGMPPPGGRGPAFPRPPGRP